MMHWDRQWQQHSNDTAQSTNLMIRPADRRQRSRHGTSGPPTRDHQKPNPH